MTTRPSMLRVKCRRGMQLLGLSTKLYGASSGVVRRSVVAGPFSGPSSGSTLPPSQSRARIRINHLHQQEAIALIDRLRQGIEYERNAGCVDVQGNRQTFSAFLGDSLDSLAKLTKTELDSSQDTIELQDVVTKLGRLRGLADQYKWMTKRERGAVLAEVMESMCRVCTESSPCPTPFPTAWKVSHETWTQQQQQQQQQQEQEQEQPESQSYTEPHQYQPKRWVPIAFDLETTGLSRIHSFPVEIAASAPLTGQRFHRLVRLPDGVSMSPSAERATGLKTERFRDPSLPTFEQVYAQFLEFIESNVAAAGFEAMPVLVGHNIADFDIPLLLNRAKASNLPAPRGARILDTMRAARQILRNYKKEDRPQGMSLSVLYTHLTGRPPQGAHRAAADVDMTVEVLMALIHHARHGPDSKGAAIDMSLLNPFFSKPHLPSAFDEGWIGDQRTSLKIQKSSQANTSSEASVKKRVGVEASRNEFGADKATHDLRFLGNGTASPFQQLQQLQQDPLVLGRGALSAKELIDQSSLFERGWRDLVADPTVRETFLMTPIRSLTGRKGFTPAQTTDLEGAGLMRMVDVLECFPRGYTTASLGCIPSIDDDNAGDGDGGDGVDQEHAVCVPVMLEDVKVTFGPQKGFSSWASMTTTFVALVDSPTSSNGRQTRLVMRTFRKGRSARWILVKEEAALRRFGGTTFAVAGKVVRRPHSQGGTPTDVWTFKEQSVKLLSMDEYAELASNQRPHIMVSYSQRGSLLPSKLASATTKAISILKAAVKNKAFQDPIPESIRSRYDLLPYADAVHGMHSPLDADHYERCRRRMAFQELFILQLKLMMQRARSQFHLLSEESPTRVSVTSTSLIDAARTVLPYQLTPAQERAMDVLLDSFTRWPPAMVLLQGDVGSGKTICAFLSVLAVTASGYQTAIMAPTEILAEQHYASLSRILEDMRNLVDEEEGQDISWAGSIPSIALLTGSTKRADRARILDDLQTGKLDIIVGTHAIISQGVMFDRLGLAVIDEQHKFGVAQRAKLLSKGSPSPHILSMSATPIPRSLALVNYGEMQLITIDELPPGRLPVTTHVLQDDNLEGLGSSRAALYSAMQKELQDGGQVYIVCPAIGEKERESVTEDEDQLSNEQLLKGAIQERDRLVVKGMVEGSQCSLLHGKMSSEEKERAMAAFASGRTPVLISTTVVEVGVDVPAASMIIVEHAERFGLAQLHQLRGRVGRGHRASTCYLVASASSGPRELERLRVLAASSSGFDIAEADFMLRGAGDIIGRRQSGKEGGGTFNVCSLPRDSALVELAREAAALHMSESLGSGLDHWPRELLAAIVDASVLDLDLASLPTLRSTDDD